MKFLIVLLFLGFSILVIAPLYADDLGDVHFTLNMSYINFTESRFSEYGIHTGLYSGLSGYALVAPNLYLGGEVGYAIITSEGEGIRFGPQTVVDEEVTYIPIELNLKYLLKNTPPELAITVGGGLSMNYAKYEREVKRGNLPREKLSIDDWLFGAQFFAEASWKITDNFFIGANGKIQATQKMDEGFKYSNWRIGPHLGFIF